MPQIGPLEIIVVSALALIVFGPEKLPEIARAIGRGAAELRRMAADVRTEFATQIDDEADEAEDPDALEAELPTKTSSTEDY